MVCRDKRTPPVVKSSGATSVSPPASVGASNATANGPETVRWVGPSALRRSGVGSSALPAGNAVQHDVIFRKVRGILNKLTPEKFDKLSLELLNIFEKALDEAKYSSIYAQLCQRLCEDAPSFESPPSNISTFRKLLLNKCQDEFENRSRATEVFDRDGPLTPEEEDQLVIARRKMLGNIKFIGELGKLDMLHEGILHQCIKQLLARKRNVPLPDQAEDLECLAQIMRTIGHRLDHDKARLWMDQYFERMCVLMKQSELPSRIRFMLQDVVELREQNWKPRRAMSGHVPKTIRQVHIEASKDYPGLLPNQMASLNMMSPMMPPSTDFFSTRSSNGTSRGPMSDMFGPLSPPFLGGGGGTGIGMGPGTIPMDNFTPNFFNSSNRGGSGPRHQQPNKGYYGRRSDEGRSSPKTDGNRTGSPQPSQETRSASPRYGNQDRNRGNHDSPPVQRSDRYRRSGDSQEFRGGQDRGGQYNRGSQNGTQNAFQNKPHFQQRGQQQQSQQPQQSGRELPPRFQKKQQQLNKTDFEPAFPESDNFATDMTPPTRNLGPPSHKSEGGPPLGADTTRDEISLRPARNFGGAPLLRPNTPSFLPRSAQQTHQPGMMQLRPRMMGPAGMPPGQVDPPAVDNPLLTTPQTQVSIRQLTTDKKKENKENKNRSQSLDSLKQTLEGILKSLLVDGGSQDVAVEGIKSLKAPRTLVPQLTSHILLHPLTTSDDHRLAVCQLISALHAQNWISSEQFIQGFELLLAEMSGLEDQVPLVKSYIGGYGAWVVSEGLISLSQLASLMELGAYYPLFLLSLQQLLKLRDRVWLVTAFHQSKLDLLNMLPECDRSSERLLEILEDRGLSFLYPLMRLQADITRQMITDPTPSVLYKWIKENVDESLQTTTGFINIVCTSIFKHVVQETSLAEGCDPTQTPDKAVVEREKELLGRYRAVIQVFVRENVQLQLTALYALQVLCYNNQFPKGMMLRMFMSLYDQEVIDEEAFIKWKEDINEDYPGKGKALFQVNQWLTWLEQAEEEDSDEE